MIVYGRSGSHLWEPPIIAASAVDIAAAYGPTLAFEAAEDSLYHRVVTNTLWYRCRLPRPRLDHQLFWAPPCQ